MESSVEVVKTITLKMSEKEAIWLKGMVQNAQGPEEHPDTAAIRRSFWDALVVALPNVPTTTMKYTPATPKAAGK